MQVDTSTPAKKRPTRLKIALNILLLAVLVGVIVWKLQEIWPQIVEYRWNLQWGWAGLALAGLLLCSGFDILIWNRTLGWFTDTLPFRHAAPVYIWSYLARYIPGKVGSLLLRVGVAAEFDRPAIPVLASSAVELALRTASALVLGFLALLSMPTLGKHPLLSIISITVAILIFLVGSHPRIMMPVTNFCLRKMKKAEITKPLRYREVLAIFAVLFCRWVLFGWAFYALIMAVTLRDFPLFVPLARVNAAVLVTAAPGAWAIGFLSFLPGGLGLMDAVLLGALVLVGGTSAGSMMALATIIVAMFRLWTLLSEGLWALIALALWRKR